MAMTELEKMRHSCAHVMATAVQEMFPDAQLGFGPPIEDGFYYDFDLPRALTPEDLKEVERRMKAVVKAADPFVYEEVSGEEALRLFEDAGQTYKVEAIQDLVGKGETISIYRSGKFFDLCAGPHVENTRRVGVYKLLSIAGAYWKGDEKRPQLQRIYATSFPSKKDLKEYLHRREEARRRDHRVLARELDLFSINPEVGAGLVLWHPKGGVLREILEDFWRAEHRKRGYDIVFTPHIGRKELWDTSGHTRWYADGLFPEMELENQTYITKPMNCPFHVKIFGSRTRSYRDLPLRFGELGTVYRYERSGVLHGAMRVRGFTQDDAHIFCRPDQFATEVVAALDIARFMLDTFGFGELEIDLSVRDESGDEKYVGADELWELAEKGLVEALEAQGLEYTRVPGEAAFYGPKIDVKVRDAIGRTWQLTTIQVDFNLPERFDIEYEDEDGSSKRPVMVHRALLGSIERFVAILIEHYAGAFPVWIAPVQVMMIPIADRHEEYCQQAAERMREAGLRVEVDARGERMNRKIRNAQMQKIPYMLVVGDRDVEAGKVSVRLRSEQSLDAMDVDTFIAAATKVAADRAEGYGFDDAD
jgi:threonyl-tRNA synthetase